MAHAEIWTNFNARPLVERLNSTHSLSGGELGRRRRGHESSRDEKVAPVRRRAQATIGASNETGRGLKKCP